MRITMVRVMSEKKGIDDNELYARNNAVGFLRLVCALVIIYTHAYPLGGFGFDPITRALHDNLGALAVATFFFLSGFLVTRSYERTGNPIRFLWHRALRIMPGFWICLVVMVCGVGPLVWIIERWSLAGYFTYPVDRPLSYLTSNAWLDMRQTGVAGIFAHLPEGFFVNGALWTLANEGKCYILLALLGWCVLRLRVPLIYPFAFAVLLLYINAPRQMDAIPLVTAVRWWFGPDVFMLQASYFFAGATYYAYRHRIVVRRAFFVCATLGVLLASLIGMQLLVLPLAVPYTVLWLALRLPTRHVERYGDISYGLYIYGWPVMQILVLLGVARLGPVPLAIASIVVTVPFALLSWRYVEAPCMRLKRGRRFLHQSQARTLVDLDAAAIVGLPVARARADIVAGALHQSPSS